MSDELHEKILIYLYELRESDEKHDLLIVFNKVNQTVLSDTIEELRKKKFIEVEYPFYPPYSLNSPSPPSFNQQNFIKAKIKLQGIEHVKNEIIFQKKINSLKTQRFWIATSISLALLAVTGYSIYQADKTNKLEIDLNKINQQKDSLTTTTTDYRNLLELKDKEIIKLKNSLDSLKIKKKTKKVITSH